MSFIAAGVVYIALCGVIGFVALAALRQRTLLAVCTAPATGSVSLALQLWVYGALRVPWSGPFLLLPWIVLALLMRKTLGGLASSLRAQVADEARAAWERSRLQMVVAIALLLLVAALLLGQVAGLATEPVLAWDAMAMWMYKARLFYQLAGVDLTPIARQPLRHLDYPPLWPLQVDSFWVVTGGLRDVPGKVVAGTHIVAGAAVLLAALQRRLGLAAAAGATLLMSASPVLLPQLTERAGYADLPCGVMLLVAAALLASEESEAQWLGVGFAALAALTKNEGIPMLIAALALTLFRVWRSAAGGRWRVAGWPGAAVPIGGVVAWALFARLHGFRSDLSGGVNVVLHPEVVGARLATIGGYAADFLARTPDDAWLAVALGVAILGGAVHPARAPRALAALLTLQVLSYVGAYLISPYNLAWHLSTSFDRLLLQVLPLTVLVLGFVAGGAEQADPVARRSRPDASVQSDER